jgi:hypothetical protein
MNLGRLIVSVLTPVVLKRMSEWPANGQRLTRERTARQARVSVNGLVSTPGAQSLGFL